MKTPIIIIILFIGYIAAKDYFHIYGGVEELISIAFYFVLTIFLLKWFIELGIKGKIKTVKENPENFKETQIDPDATDKEEIFKEFQKFDEIIKIKIISGIRKNFLSKRTPEERKYAEWEVLIKTVEGVEIWYRIHSKEGKITKIDKNVSGVE